ncbi:hypothetical protein RKE25_18410 [Dyella sp. BiH032]|uniref:hypothetical protein n=1 Tax=Dyella sp. BiH032 TaxID=3075430 RepID=UPI002892FB88|nr:hypothetical protein [Dyella sp. BiH032]WNL45371.1 hypothetical protein RKE25_18410 [Dyella sp. BiH032]
MNDSRAARALRWCGRFLYAFAWPALLFYAFLFGGSLGACLRENGSLFGWPFFLWVVSAMYAWPAVLVVLAGCIAAATVLPEAARGSWARRMAWLAGASVAALAVGWAVGGVGSVCHLAW